MDDPFDISGPALISFSGGRTSGYMLRRILDCGLQPDVHVVFSNTGKERPETLDFVRDCGVDWGVPIVWLEYRDDGFAEVDHGSASRDGSPFAALIRKRKFLPNPVARFCTQELKIRIMGKFMRGLGHDHWTNVVGIRADEPRRIAKILAPNRERWENVAPLAAAGVTEPDVLAWWKRQPFDLRLRSHEGNCDLCFLKGRTKREAIIRDRPDLAQWWAEQEAATGGRFRAHSPDYATLMRQGAETQPLPFSGELPDDLADCICNA